MRSMAQSDPGIWQGAGLSKLGPQVRRRARPGASSAHTKQKSWTIAPPAVDHGSLLLPIRKLIWENLAVAWSGPSQFCLGRSQKHRPTHWEVWPSAPSDRKGWWEHLETAYPSNSGAEMWAGRADHPQSKASGPVWSGNLGHRLAWVKTTNKEH